MTLGASRRRRAAESSTAPVRSDGDDQFKLLVDSVRDYAILTLDVDGHITSWNAGAEHIKGYRPNEILGRHFSVFYPPEDVANGKPAAELLIAVSEGRLEDEGWRVRKDGSRFWANVIITALFDNGHRLRGFGKVTRDMSERRAGEQALAQARDAAVQANLEAQAATRAKSAFLATMSHEIRTPLNAVIGMTSLLLEAPLPEEQRGYVDIAHDSGEALLAIINDILDFSKIESGHLELEEAPFDLRDCLENALGQLRHVAGQRGLELVAEVAKDCPRVVVGDANRFRQVVVNLLSNAVKFTAEGEVALTAACEQVTERTTGSVTVSVQVRDTGSGIPEDRLSRLFQPFSQVDSSTTRVYGGTGLGLAISRRLAQAMGGDLDVVSVVGEGSTFSFTAVLRRSVDGALVAGVGPAGPLAGRRVLVVDGDEASQTMLSSLLARWGLTCVGVASAAEALELLSEGHGFDAVLLDLELPAVTGQPVISVLRALPAAATLPIVGLSGPGWNSNPAAQGVVDGLVSKPVTSNALRGTLLQLLAPADAALVAVQADQDGRLGGAAPRRVLQVLLAEDNVVNQRVGQLLLDSLGHDVHIVDNGGEALAAVQTRNFDVVLMDVQMPQMDGLEATRRIRAELPVGRQPHIVAMTANAFADDWAACAAAGMDDYLAKPVRVKDLEAKLSLMPKRVPQS